MRRIGQNIFARIGQALSHRFILPSVLGYLFLIGPLLVAEASRAASPITITHSGSDRLEFSVQVDSIGLVEMDLRDGALTLFESRLEGFVNMGEPMQVARPAWGTWIIVPPGTRPVLEEISSEWRDLDDQPMMRVPVPVVLPDPSGDHRLSEQLILPGESARGSVKAGDLGIYRDQAEAAALDRPIMLGEVTAWRDRRVAALSLRPLVVDGSGRARKHLLGGAWRIRFLPDKAADRGWVSSESLDKDGNLGNLFLNSHMLSSLPGEIPARLAADKAPKTAQRIDPVMLLAPEVRLPVSRTGFYKVLASNLSINGKLDVEGLREDQIRLYQRRYVGGDDIYATVEVPILMVSDGGVFAGTDYFIFYGLRPRDDKAFVDAESQAYPDGDDILETYNPTTVDEVNGGLIYYLAAGDPPPGRSWARMAELSLPGASGPSAASYRRVDYHEEDLGYSFRPYDAHGDRNHWNGVYTPGGATVPFTLKSPDPSAADARLRVGGFGFSNRARDYALRLYSDVDTLVTQTVNANHSEFTFDSGATLSLGGVSDWTFNFDNANPFRDVWGYLDWFELSYQALYQAVGNALEFNCGPGTGSVPIRVSGFSNTDLRLFDLSDPRRPAVVALEARNFEASGGSYTLSLTAAQDTPEARIFQAVPEYFGGLVEYQYFKASVFETGLSPIEIGSDPDVLAIIHPKFSGQAERWAEHRRSMSRDPLEIHIVDVHQIYDWFGGGLKTPTAIRRFVNYGMTEWGSWALQIFGDANGNARGLGNIEERFDKELLRDWVPTYMLRWRDGSGQLPNELLPADQWFTFTDPNADWPLADPFLPGMLVGRFPGNTTEQMDIMIDKVIRFEQEDSGAAWKRRALFLADDSWSQYDDGTKQTQDKGSAEMVFRWREEACAARWETHPCPDGDCPPEFAFTSERIFIEDYLDRFNPDGNLRSWPEFEGHALDNVWPVLISELSEGSLFFCYQGHANDFLFAHELIIEDINPRVVGASRQDILGPQSFNNPGKPFIFIGLACHISAWARGAADSNPQDIPSLGEKFLIKPNAGSVATYASPGYEYITSSAAFSLTQFNTWLDTPSRGQFPGNAGRSRWVLGDMFLQAEAAFTALSPGSEGYRLLAADYCLLGDALMVVDTGPPRVSVTSDGVDVEDGRILICETPDNVLVLRVDAEDEAGIERILIRDSFGNDLSASATGGVSDGAPNDRFATYDVRLPIRPFAHEIELHVYDTADVGDNDVHFSRTYSVPMNFSIFLDGAPYEPGSTMLLFGEPLHFTGTAEFGAFLAEDVSLDLNAEGLDLEGVTVMRVDQHNLRMAFTVTIPESQASSVFLAVGGYLTEIPIIEAEQEGVAGLTDLNAFPNPAVSETRFLFRTGMVPCDGEIQIYSVAGDIVARVPILETDFRPGGNVIVGWDLRDRHGDRPANGTYFYRVDLHGETINQTSAMQRLVLMR